MFRVCPSTTGSHGRYSGNVKNLSRYHSENIIGTVKGRGGVATGRTTDLCSHSQPRAMVSTAQKFTSVSLTSVATRSPEAPLSGKMHASNGAIDLYGSGDQRVAWSTTGFESGYPDFCDTFGKPVARKFHSRPLAVALRFA